MPKMKITLEEVNHVAKLAHLTLSDEETSALRADLDAILGYVQQLEELDVSDVEPTTHAVHLEMPMRQDVVVPTVNREDILSNAPDHDEGMFKVPRIVEGGN